MTSRYRYTPRPPHVAPSDVSEEYSSDYSSDAGEHQPGAEPNNRRLRQAIHYLEVDGGIDSDQLYKERLYKIDSEILEKFLDEGYAFDEGLYARLEELMEQKLNAIEEAEAVAREEDEYEQEQEMEEVRSPRALHRGLERSTSFTEAGPSKLPALRISGAQSISKGKGKEKADVGQERSTPRSAGSTASQVACEGPGKGKGKAVTQSPRTPSTPRATGLRPEVSRQTKSIPTTAKTAAAGTKKAANRAGTGDAPVREIQWRYGGPRNDPEIYHRNAPDSLPFGETLAFQEYESLMIDYDLAQGPMREGPVETHVDFDVVRQSMGSKATPYDSGSRFKLIDDDEAVRAVRSGLDIEDGQRVGHAGGGKGNLLEQVVGEFNSGDMEHQEEKDYVPRVFLEEVRFPREIAPRRTFSRRGSTGGQRTGAGGASGSSTTRLHRPITTTAASGSGTGTRPRGARATQAAGAGAGPSSRGKVAAAAQSTTKPARRHAVPISSSSPRTSSSNVGVSIPVTPPPPRRAGAGAAGSKRKADDAVSTSAPASASASASVSRSATSDRRPAKKVAFARSRLEEEEEEAERGDGSPQETRPAKKQKQGRTTTTKTKTSPHLSRQSEAGQRGRTRSGLRFKR
ncbi:uncharacterized protein EI97DRAFT_446404 [Westerdykella ornata]|uniref:Uncharacterized protein n=1 Tax=Westerdykella ornata TaxID=318751 RepID=A0A6A6J4Z0_WESOR|nr:uncharacterized protein EI97DRAFT_446404 [Westerdykella ornata]KAF2271650.1 hypothetical protein EI97DRAFT_446404 [Westerdykella ornata]